MMLAEALVQRAALQTRLEELKSRIEKSALVTEGSDPAEDANALMREADDLLDQLARLIKQINDTNSHATLPDGRTLTHALADRDVLAKRVALYHKAAEAGTAPSTRYSRNELRYVSKLDVPALRARADELARSYRELDTRIQGANWTTTLVEE